MAGAGNDFIVIEARKGINLKKLAVAACDRTTGIGADGIWALGRLVGGMNCAQPSWTQSAARLRATVAVRCFRDTRRGPVARRA